MNYINRKELCKLCKLYKSCKSIINRDETIAYGATVQAPILSEHILIKVQNKVIYYYEMLLH